MISEFRKFAYVWSNCKTLSCYCSYGNKILIKLCKTSLCSPHCLFKILYILTFFFLNRYIYLGLPAALRGSSFIPAILILIILRKYHPPGESTSSGTAHVEGKFTGKENECQEMDQLSKILNDNELKTKL